MQQPGLFLKHELSLYGDGPISYHGLSIDNSITLSEQLHIFKVSYFCLYEGVAVVIGVETKRVLSVKPRNSACHTCKVSSEKIHDCAKNHHGSSGSMEVIGLVEAFNEAPEKYSCYYLEYVADGDSTTADAILCNVR